MESLKNKEILIGREPLKHRLLVAVKSGGLVKVAAIGDEGSVPNCVSGCKPGENIAHAKISFGQDGMMLIHNLKPQNVTYVNDSEVETKELSANSKVSLGQYKFPVDVKKVLDTARKLACEMPASGNQSNGHSIRHLERVWEKYDNDLYKLQKRQKNLGLIRSLYIPLTVISTGLGTVFQFIGLDKGVANVISTFMFVVAAFVLFYGLYKAVTDKSLEERKRLDEKFREDYVCPCCKRFLGVLSYKLLRQNRSCRCNWTE